MPQKYTSRAPGASVLHHRFGTARHGTTLHGMAQHGTARHSTAHGTRHTVHDTRHTAHGHHQPQQQQQPQSRISFSTAMHSMCSHQDQPHLQHWLHREATKTCTTRLPRCRKLLAVIRLGGCCCYCQDVVSSFRSANVGTSAKVYFWIHWGTPEIYLCVAPFLRYIFERLDRELKERVPRYIFGSLVTHQKYTSVLPLS